MSGALVLSWGRWGGVYVHRGALLRICLGWVALTFISGEFDDLLNDALEVLEHASDRQR